MDDFWNDPEMFGSDDYVKFEAVNDSVTGTITAIRKHMFDDGKIVPQIELDTAEGAKTLTAGQVRLKVALQGIRPKVGDQITVTLTEIEKRSGGKTLKHFDVVKGGPVPPVAPATSHPAPAPVVAPAATPANPPVAPPVPTNPLAGLPADNPLAGLTAEQIAALKNLI